MSLILLLNVYKNTPESFVDSRGPGREALTRMYDFLHSYEKYYGTDNGEPVFSYLTDKDLYCYWKPLNGRWLLLVFTEQEGREEYWIEYQDTRKKIKVLIKNPTIHDLSDKILAYFGG